MAQVNPLTRELLVKLVYYGPGLGGKTTSLQCVHGASPPETRGQLVSLATPVDRTLYFDFLPLRARTVRDHQVRLQLFTVPGQVYFNATRKLVLTGADGVIFVADSQVQRQDANLESLENLAANLKEQGRRLDDLCLVFEYNKRDLKGVMSTDEMDRVLNQLRRPSFATIATEGDGIMQTLDRLVEDVLEDLERRGTFGPKPIPSAAPAFEAPEKTLEEQMTDAAMGAEWKTTAERALIHATNPSYFPEASDQERAPSRFPSRSSIAGALRGPRGPSWAVLFGDMDAIEALEKDIAGGRYASAIAKCDRLVRGLLEDTAISAGMSGTEVPLLAPWLGIPSSRWLAFRQIVRRARDGGPLDLRDALHSYGLLIQLRLTLAP